MKLLLDTQCWLWMTSRPERFSNATRERLVDTRTELLLSAASVWEIAIKYAGGKLKLPEAPPRYVASRLGQTRTTCLSISCDHASRVSELPLHHRDPFDRLLVAQAQLEQLAIVTADPLFGLYDVDVITP